MARRCGAKHIFKSKCTKHLSAGPILDVPILQNGTSLWSKCTKHPRRGAIFEVTIWKNGTPLWREAHFIRVGPIFAVPISKNGTPLWREAHLQVKMLKTQGFGPRSDVEKLVSQ